MARRSKTEDLLDMELPPTQTELDLEDFFESVGPSLSSVDIYKLGKNGGKAYKARVVFNELKENAMEYIKTEYGPGKWLLSFRDAGGKIRGNKSVEIDSDEPAKPIEHLNGNADVLTTKEMMLMMFNMMKQPAPTAPPTDWAAIITAGAALLSAINSGKKDLDVASLIAALKPPDASAMLSNLVTAVGGLKPKESNGIEEAAKIVRLAKDLSPDNKNSEPPDSMWGVVSEIGKHVADRFIPGGGAGIRPALVPASTNGTEVSTLPPDGLGTTTPTQPGGREQMVQLIRAGLVYLKQKAQMNKDPDFYIETIMENQEEPQWQALLYAMSQGATFENLLTFDAEIAQNPMLKGWFKKVYDGLRAELYPNDNPGGPSGDVGNTTGDAAPSTTGTSASTHPIPSEHPHESD